MAAKSLLRIPLRLLRLWGMYARMDLLWITRDLKIFLMWTISDTVLNVASITGILLLAERFAGIGAWNKLQVVFMLGYATVVSGLLDMLFGFNVVMISRRLGRGQLDHTLIQPQPVWMALATEGFCPFSGSATFLAGLGLLFWSDMKLGLGLTFGRLALIAVNIAASTAIIVAFQFAWGSLAFWAPRAAEEINSASRRLIDQLKAFPLDGLHGALAGGLMTLFPVGFLAWYPCRTLLGLELGSRRVLATPLAALAFVGLAGWLFARGRKQYGRTGSHNYSSFGHRR
jgi:ABC-2 type transport system permease protein